MRTCPRDNRIWQPAQILSLWCNARGHLPASHSMVPHCFIVCDVSLHSSGSGGMSPWQLDRYCAGDIIVLFLRPTRSAHTYILLFVMFTIHFNPGEDQWSKLCVFHALLGWPGALYSWFLPVLPRVYEKITLLVYGDPQLPMGSWWKMIPKPIDALSLRGTGVQI